MAIIGVFGTLGLGNYLFLVYARSHTMYEKGSKEHKRVTDIVFDYGMGRTMGIHKAMLKEDGNRTGEEQVNRMEEILNRER